MKVQWRVVVCCAVLFIAWIVAEEVDRKLIIHLPHVHRPTHKHVTRQTHKPSSHKGHDRPGDHVHKHHHHFHDEEYGEGNHGHGYEDHGHHHTRKYRRQPHHHHSSSGHRHHPSHHYDSHHDSHHVDHHHDDEYNPRYRTEESRYHYDHYSEPSHHHHRPMRYEEDDEYDCMEVCEKCKMLYHRKHMRESEVSASRPHPQLTVAKFKPTPSSSTSSFMSRIKEDFKPSLAAGELSESPSGYDENNYAGFAIPTAIDHSATAGKLSSINIPLRNAGNTDDYGPVFPSFQSSEFMPSGSWQNGSFFYGKYKDPAEKVVEYNVPRGQMKHVRYGEEEIRHEDSKSNDERGRNLRYLNRYKYIKR